MRADDDATGLSPMASRQFPRSSRRSRSPTERRGNLLCVTNLRSTPVHPETGKRRRHAAVTRRAESLGYPHSGSRHPRETDFCRCTRFDAGPRILWVYVGAPADFDIRHQVGGMLCLGRSSRGGTDVPVRRRHWVDVQPCLRHRRQRLRAAYTGRRPAGVDDGRRGRQPDRVAVFAAPVRGARPTRSPTR